jgi:hypothetical protein
MPFERTKNLNAPEFSEAEFDENPKHGVMMTMSFVVVRSGRKRDAKLQTKLG